MPHTHTRTHTHTHTHTHASHATRARVAAVAVVFVGLGACNEGESHDRNEHLPTEGSLELPGSQQQLVEAVAKILHKDMRVSHWGYAAGESLTPEDMLKVKYQGIRPAPGYPTQPDHTEKNLMWKLLDAEKATGIHKAGGVLSDPSAAIALVLSMKWITCLPASLCGTDVYGATAYSSSSWPMY